MSTEPPPQFKTSETHFPLLNLKVPSDVGPLPPFAAKEGKRRMDTGVPGFEKPSVGAGGGKSGAFAWCDIMGAVSPVWRAESRKERGQR